MKFTSHDLFGKPKEITSTERMLLFSEMGIFINTIAATFENFEKKR